MPSVPIYRFEHGGRRYAIDTETCFCFECDDVSWDVLEYYPDTPVNHIFEELKQRHPHKELEEVVGELEWLRSTKSILNRPKAEEVLRKFEVKRGLKSLSVCLPEPGAVALSKKGWFGARASEAPPSHSAWVAAAAAMLIGRSGDSTQLELELVVDGTVHDPGQVAELCTQAFQSATLAGKALKVSLRVRRILLQDLAGALEGHTVSATLELTHIEQCRGEVREFAKALGGGSARLAKFLQPTADHSGGRIIVRPGHPQFGGVAEALDNAGFVVIELDLDGAYARTPGLKPETMLPALGKIAMYYAGRLLKHRYFRLDPIAPLFWRIYNGSPITRSDPAGLSALAVDEHGDIYPSHDFAGNAAYKLGSVPGGVVDEDAVRRFEDVGVMTTPACLRCWARHLCGGGSASVHAALSGSHREPNEAWCNAQREWMRAAVSAFSLLSAQGVNFTRIYNALGKTAQPSMFSLVKAAFRMSIGIRAIEESDADMLTQWENWSHAAYFLFNETGLLLATRYDREMDALHPRGIDKELVLIRKNGDPFGLLKMRPERFPGTAQAWIFMKEAGDYASGGVRKSFRAILKEMGGQQAFRRVLVPAASYERDLHAFLDAVGFKPLGTQRDALFLHGDYHDVVVYAIEPARM